MIPYFAFANILHALLMSIGITLILLLAFGYVRAVLTGLKGKDVAASIVQTVAVGVVAAGTSYGIVRGINSAMGE